MSQPRTQRQRKPTTQCCLKTFPRSKDKETKEGFYNRESCKPLNFWIKYEISSHNTKWICKLCKLTIPPSDSCFWLKTTTNCTTTRSFRSPLQSWDELYQQVARQDFSFCLFRWLPERLRWPIYRSDGGMYSSLVLRHQPQTEAGTRRDGSEAARSKIRCILKLHRAPSGRDEPGFGPKNEFESCILYNHNTNPH